jgi:hypothetical protein
MLLSSEALCDSINITPEKFEMGAEIHVDPYKKSLFWMSGFTRNWTVSTILKKFRILNFMKIRSVVLESYANSQRDMAMKIETFLAYLPYF